MATIKQEFDSSGIPSMKPYLDYLLDNGAATHETVKWGSSERWVIIMGGVKSTNIRADMTLIRV